MKIVIPGGSGQVGTLLARHFHQQGHTRYRAEPRPEAGSMAGDSLGRSDGRRMDRFAGAERHLHQPDRT